MKNLFVSNSKGSITRSISTILIGGVLLIVPGLTMKTVMMVIGAMLLVSGLITLILSNLRMKRNRIGFWSVQGVMNIIFGMVFITSPTIMIKIFMVFIGIILLIMGFIQLAGSLGSLTRSVWAWLFMIIGLFTLGSGIFLLSNPFKSAEAILPFLGALLILNGISDLFRARKIDPKSPKYNGSEVQDIPYEEV